MELQHGIHLGYCTNIHRGDSWEETFQGLRNHTAEVRRQVCAASQPYGIGLRLSAQAAHELARPEAMTDFRQWLDANNSYVFTINGFPHGSFHGAPVKERVFQPDWTSAERLRYTKQLFDILVQLLPAGLSGSVSTLPGSHKEFGLDAQGLGLIYDHLADCAGHIEDLAEHTGHDLHLGLEPEPLGLFETSGETLKFFALYMDRAPQDQRFFRRIGVNYDTCHLAIEFETAKRALDRLHGAGIRISKLHLSSALRLQPTSDNLQRLSTFVEPVYFHQVIAFEGEDSPLRRYRDLPEALKAAELQPPAADSEWRVHFHIPLHARPADGFLDTQDHLLEALDWMSAHPHACQHLEMETYTWEVLPSSLRSETVVQQLVREYEWTLQELRARALA